MVTRPLSEAEQNFAEVMQVIMDAFSSLQERAEIVAQTGGSCRDAFLSLLDDEGKQAAAAYWPMIQMALGVAS